MKRLSKTQVREKEALAAAIRTAEALVSDAVDEYNDAVAAARAKLAREFDKLNEAITAADEWRSGIASEMADFAAERSDAWTESDRGQSYASWQNDWEADLEPAEMPAECQSAAAPDSAGDNFEALADEPE